MAMHTGCFGDMDIASSTNHTLLCQFDEKPSIISGCTECCVPCATAVFQLLLLLLRSSSSPTFWISSMRCNQAKRCLHGLFAPVHVISQFIQR